MKIARTLLASAAAFVIAAIVLAQTPSPSPTPQAARRPDEPRAGLTAATTLAAPDEEPGPGQPRGFRFRNLGPAAGGGRITAIAGIPGDPNVIYLGSASGGVFKTVDGGVHLEGDLREVPALHRRDRDLARRTRASSGSERASRTRATTSSTATASTSRPDAGSVLAVHGSGRCRADLPRSSIDPTSPRTRSIVAVLGNVWKPNVDRGVFRTTDGGQTWKKVLYVDDQTGASRARHAAGQPEGSPRRHVAVPAVSLGVRRRRRRAPASGSRPTAARPGRSSRRTCRRGRSAASPWRSRRPTRTTSTP